jgi:hypothetical protein
VGRKLVSWLSDHAEDVALALGVAAITAGVSLRVGLWAALVTFGVLSVTYGVWITKGGAAWASHRPEE